MEYPEHEKMKKIADKSQTIGEFLEWINQEGYAIGEFNRMSGELDTSRKSIQDLLAEFFDIDLNKIDKEKRAMIKSLQ